MDCIIYKIIDNTNDNLYIGSTTQSLKNRLKCHRNKKKCSSYQIIENGDYIIAEIEKCDVENRRYREQYWIDNSENCVNKIRAYQTKEQRKEEKRQNDKIRYKEKQEKINKRKNELYHYQNSWAGDKRYNNNLLEIDINLFRI